ncbi:MAG: sugar nucleotide-binding protein [Gammaproteobacteria bacterium]|nr:sugar nucleotide-binding protein [Gammaproteobacteria bacterium]
MKQFERVLITGCGGMLGNAVYPYFLKQCKEVLATDKEISDPWLSPLDVRDEREVKKTFDRFNPDLVLHLAAETDLEFCETYPDVAEATNSRSTRYIAELANKKGATLVYISTAGVFGGTKEESYTEEDEATPIMVYGQTKFDGENHVREVIGKHYILRAGWMVGGGLAKDHKFVSKILEQIAEGRVTIHAVDDRWGTPTYTHDFANNMFRLLGTEQYGTYHMVCEGSGTRYDVAKEIAATCGREDIEVKPVGSEHFAVEYFAPRPRSEMMINANLEALGINLMRPWQAALREYIYSEYSHLLTSAAREQAGLVENRTERRVVADRRTRNVYTSKERRQLVDRRAVKLKH